MVTWSRPPVPPRLLACTQEPLVGRRGELELMEEIWAAVTGGARQVVFVGGEPGAGKTRLVAEIGSILADHDVAVLVGTSAADYGLPYQPFVEVLDHLFTAVEPGTLELEHVLGDGARVLGRLTPTIARYLTGTDDRPEPPGDVRGELFGAMAGLLRSLTHDRPVVMVLEDMHWAQRPTLALLNYIVTNVVDARLLLLATFRTTSPDRSDDLSVAIADLYRLEGVRRVDLPGLDTDDIAEYLRHQGGVAAAAARGFAPMLRDQTGGNPFFLRELWRELQQRGGLSALRAGRVPAPRSIGDTLVRRLTGLDNDTRKVIEAAAVIGDVFDVATVAAASGTEPSQALAAVDAAAAIGMVEPSADSTGAYAYVHALSRQAVLERLAPSRLTELHACAAAALEPRSTEPQVIPHLAHHYLHCHILGYGPQAVHYAKESARLAERSLAFEEAAAWLERATDVADLDAAARTELLFAAARNHVRAGRFAHARRIYEQLASSADPDTRLAAAMGYEDASWRPGRLGSRPADLLTEALESTALTADDPRHVAGLASLARALTFAGDATRARQVGDRAIELAGRLNDEQLLTHALSTSLWHGLAPEHAEIQLSRAVEVAERSRGTGDNDVFLSASYFRAMASYVLGRPQELATAASDYHQAAAASGEPFLQYVGGCLEQGRSFLRGDLAAARRQAEELVELGQAFGPDQTEGSYGLQIFMLQRETGQLESVRPLISGDESFHGHWVPGLLAVYTELGLEAGMRRALQHVLETVTEARTMGAQWPAELAFTTEAALALEDRQALEWLQHHLARFAGRNMVTGEFVATFGAADRYLARIAALLGDHDRAEELFRAASAMDERMGAAVHVAETLLHHGLYVLTTGDQSRARRLFERAREIAERAGQTRVLRQLPAEKEEGPDGLTEREVEVLRLLATGLSNREIGQHLYISANTAANHVRSILMKTGAANRTQAAMYAADRHLV